MRSPPRSNGSWAAVASFRMLLVVALFAGACSSPQNTATQPSPTATGSTAASPTGAVEEDSGYKLASTYYGWNFNVDPEKVTCP